MRAQIASCASRAGRLGSDKHRPLEGKRVVVTRAPEQAQEFVKRLEEMGAEVLLCPVVGFSDADDFGPLDGALRSLGNFDWILFTSANAVRFFCKRCRALGLDLGGSQSPRPMVASVGPATAQVAMEEGLRVDHVASRHNGKALAEELWGAVTGRKVLLPRSDRAGDELPTALRSAGAEVVEVVAYRTTGPSPSGSDVLECIRAGKVDVLTFASPSAFHNFGDAVGTDVLGELAAHATFAAIGPTTAGAIREAGLRVGIEAAEGTAAGFATAIAKYFEHSPSGVKSR
jgi:uroporphyrinogen III methyltransferase/synthase